MTKESGPRRRQVGPAAGTDQAARAGSQLGDTVLLGVRHHHDVLYDMWYGRESPSSEALDKAAADHFAALKSMLTPEREAALRNL